MGKENRKLRVFLCHSKDDKPKVRELYRRLVIDGFDAWLDEEKLMPGQDWDLEIRKAVRESDAIVVCLSNNSVTKAGYVQKEIRFALDVADEQLEGEIFLIPARLEDCHVPNRLDKWQWVDLFEKTGIEKLNQALNIRAKSLSIVVTPTYYPLMVLIPAGNFLMGSTKEQIEQAIKQGADENWVKWEQPQHTVELPEYFIGKYPVTNREYQVFVRDTNYLPLQFWVSDQFLIEKGNHPVADVSWHDAIAYCKWLSEKSGKQFRLPTEAEWEKASRGDDGRMWSWGNEFDEKKANTAEANIGETTPVGQFSPQGDSPYGCADMIGNIWEWTSSLWGKDWQNPNFKYPYKRDDGREELSANNTIFRVLRGGSFGYSSISARCARRSWGLPGIRNNGFRVALSTG